MIADRVVARLGRGEGPDAPAAERRTRHERPNHRRGAFRIGDAGQQRLAGIGSADTAGSFIAVKREDIGAERFVEKTLVEPFAQYSAFSLQCAARSG